MQVECKTRNHAALRTRERRFGRGAIAAALIGTLVAPGCSTDTQAAPCPSIGSSEPSAADISIEVRRLQTNLMVAALSCGARNDYNDFVIAYRPSLQKYGKEIRTEFRRRYGKAGNAKLNQFVTRLANEASARSNADRENFCAEATASFQEAKLHGATLTKLVTVPSRQQVASAGCDATTAGIRAVSTEVPSSR
jgi:hypothetical protein